MAETPDQDVTEEPEAPCAGDVRVVLATGLLTHAPAAAVDELTAAGEVLRIATARDIAIGEGCR